MTRDSAWRLLAAALAQSVPPSAQQNDFPTLERVQFVETCIREHPDRSRQEMIYKCSCAVDAIAEEVTYAEYVGLIYCLSSRAR